GWGEWMCAGLVFFFGACVYAELGGMLPNSGGQYLYLREAYGPLPAFLCGWSFFLIIQTGSIATVSVGSGIYLSSLVPWLPGAAVWAPPFLIGILTAINYRGVRAGANVQLAFTALKVLGLALLMIAALFVQPVSLSLALSPANFSMSSIGMAMLGCFVAYDG